MVAVEARLGMKVVLEVPGVLMRQVAVVLLEQAEILQGPEQQEHQMPLGAATVVEEAARLVLLVPQAAPGVMVDCPVPVVVAAVVMAMPAEPAVLAATVVVEK